MCETISSNDCSIIIWLFFLLFQSSKVNIEHVESRVSQAPESKYEILLHCVGIKGNLLHCADVLRQNAKVQNLTIVSDMSVEKKGK